jgi:hypothetical protein
MIIDCPICDAKVDAEVLCEHEYPQTEYTDPYKYVFLLCPFCENTMVGIVNFVQIGPYEEGWDSKAKRVWPKAKDHFMFNIPSLVGASLEEAKRCFEGKAYSACAVMCGRALEAISITYTKKKNMAQGLKELRDKEIIDTRLYNWSEILRKERNIGAHPSGEETSKQDAQDLLDFLIAICDYIFVLSEKYDNFIKKKNHEPI